LIGQLFNAFVVVLSPGTLSCSELNNACHAGALSMLLTEHQNEMRTIAQQHASPMLIELSLQCQQSNCGRTDFLFDFHVPVMKKLSN